MLLALPQEVEAHLDVEEARLGLAVGLYVRGRLGLGRAAEVAGLSRPAFQALLGRNRIPVDYSLLDLKEDAQALGMDVP